MSETEVPPIPPRLRPYLDEIAERLWCMNRYFFGCSVE